MCRGIEAADLMHSRNIFYGSRNHFDYSGTVMFAGFVKYVGIEYISISPAAMYFQARSLVLDPELL